MLGVYAGVMAALLENTDLKARVAGEVRAWRGRLGTTQKEMADALGLYQPGVSDRLKGRVAFSLEELIILAAYWDITLGDLLGERLVNEKIPVPEDRGVGSTAD